jgi:hypothetical protein
VIDDRENEEFLGFDLDNIEEAEERYIWQLDVLNDFDRRTKRKLTAILIRIMESPLYLTNRSKSTKVQSS